MFLLAVGNRLNFLCSLFIVASISRSPRSRFFAARAFANCERLVASAGSGWFELGVVMGVPVDGGCLRVLM